jgi:Reverse transcriptase (RNA-dependent DNA polymerase)
VVSFDHLDHGWMLKFVQHRVADPRIIRLIQKWLKAGVMEQGQWAETKEGSPQGAVISPILANLYLHYVLDLWVEQWRKKRASGDVIIVRYADDAVLGFEHRVDAERFLEELRERLGKFGLELHPEKTRLIEFGRFAQVNRQRRGEGKAGNLQLSGFHPHLWDQLPDGQLHGAPEDDGQTPGRQAQGNSSATAQANARRPSANFGVAAAGGAGVFPVSRGSGQLGAIAGLPPGSPVPLVSGAQAPEPAYSTTVEYLPATLRCPAATRPNSATLSQPALRRRIALDPR